jgi:hypothetical protein
MQGAGEEDSRLGMGSRVHLWLVGVVRVYWSRIGWVVCGRLCGRVCSLCVVMVGRRWDS